MNKKRRSAQERVMVVPANVINQILHGARFAPNGREIWNWILSQYSFLDRTNAEDDTKFKQIIPYCLLTYFNPTWEETEFFLHRRKNTQAESRLHNMWSIGVGGHANEDDEWAGEGIVHAAMQREVSEEITINADTRQRCLGFVNDDSTEVGRVHLGVVFQLELEKRLLEIKESNKMEGYWALFAEALELKGKMESWSQILLDHLLIPNRGKI